MISFLTSAFFLSHLHKIQNYVSFDMIYLLSCSAYNLHVTVLFLLILFVEFWIESVYKFKIGDQTLCTVYLSNVSSDG